MLTEHNLMTNIFCKPLHQGVGVAAGSGTSPSSV